MLSNINGGIFSQKLIMKILKEIKMQHKSTCNISSLLIWVFYLPSQVLLSISGYKFTYKFLRTKQVEIQITQCSYK